VLLYQLAVSIPVGLAVLPFSGPALRDPGLLPVLALLFQGIYINAFTFVLWFWLMSRYSTTGLASFTFLTPAFGVLGGALILGEPLSVRIFVALALIAAGLIIVNRPIRERVAPI
jgi:drug/metabolite transporter (DMT)-like permease